MVQIPTVLVNATYMCHQSLSWSHRLLLRKFASRLTEPFFSMTCEREVSANKSDVEYKLKGFMFLINRWDFFYIHTDEAQLLVSKCCSTVAYFLHFRNWFNTYNHSNNWILILQGMKFSKIQLNYVVLWYIVHRD